MINNIVTDNVTPLQIFITGGAGTGKTYTLILPMESSNMYYQIHNSYVACGTTEK